MTGVRKVAVVASNVIAQAMNSRSLFFDHFEQHSGDDIKAYAIAHKRGTGLENRDASRWYEEACGTGEIFPGRPFVPPSIDFGTTSNRENERSCTKNCASAKSDTLVIFTVQCFYRYLKLLNVSVITKTERLSTVLSVLPSRFEPYPKFIYYHNSCNMARSIVLRSLWINDECTIVCDRFHYAGHICNSIAGPYSYTECSLHAMSGTESIKQLWAFCKSHLLFSDRKT